MFNYTLGNKCQGKVVTGPIPHIWYQFIYVLCEQVFLNR